MCSPAPNYFEGMKDQDGDGDGDNLKGDSN